MCSLIIRSSKIRNPSVKFLLVFTGVQLLLYKFVPGARFNGPQTENGHVPKYCDNGLVCFLMTNIIFYFLVVQMEIFPVTFIYDELIPLLTLLNFSSLVLCVFLYLKGLFFPSTQDHGSCGNFAIDMYWGTELYPQFLGIDLKQFVICRMGMVLWYFFAVSFFFAAERDLRSKVSEPDYYGNINGQFASVARFLNMLIAQIGDSFDHVQENERIMTILRYVSGTKTS